MKLPTIASFYYTFLSFFGYTARMPSCSKISSGYYGWEAGKYEVVKKWKFVKLFFIYDEVLAVWFWDGNFNRF